MTSGFEHTSNPASQGRLALHIAVTGERSFARRHRLLFHAIATRCERLSYITTPSTNVALKAELLARETAFIARRIAARTSPFPRRAEDLRRLRRAFVTSVESFRTKSLHTEQNLRRLASAPDVVLQIFSLFRPYWTGVSIPYVHYLDFTTALSRRNWPPDTPPMCLADYERWVEVEGAAYRGAAHLFAMSERVRRSLIRDYGVSDGAITVVGSGGQFRETYEGTKTFGNKQILFNGRPFERKGGDLALAAFRRVRRDFPEARLVVIGTRLKNAEPGVVNPGFVSDVARMRRLFLASDVVIAPSRWDAFPGFVIEAMMHGVPPVVSPVGGMAEIVDDDANGIVLNGLEVSELAEKLARLLADVPTLERFSSAARTKARARFSWDAIAARMLVPLREIDNRLLKVPAS